MVSKLLTPCGFSATKPGKDSFKIGSALSGYALPSDAGAIDAKSYRYYAVSQDGAEFEGGEGPYNAVGNVLIRDQIAATSNGDTDPVDFTLPPSVYIFPTPVKYLEQSNVENNGFFFVATPAPHQGWWFLDNATWDGSHFFWINNTNAAFAVNIRAEFNIPGEAATTGLMFWKAIPTGSGTHQISDTYGAQGGWENMFLMTEFSDLVVGGFGIEIDGAGANAYGRVVNNVFQGQRFVGMLRNFFADYSGVDNLAQPSWQFGVIGDKFAIQRSAPGDPTGAAIQTLLTIDNTGALSVGGGIYPGGGGGTTSPGYTYAMSAANVNSLSAGKFWPAINAQNGTAAGSFTYYNSYTVNGAANPTQSSVFTSTIQWKSVSYGGGSVKFNAVAIKFRYFGLGFNFQFVAQPFQNFKLKIDGNYANNGNPIDTTTLSSGNYYYFGVAFPVAAWHTIEMIFPTGLFWSGIWTHATDTILPVVQHNERIIFIGDSFCEGAGSASLGATGYVNRVTDGLGWDNYLQSGVGGTGLLNTFGSSGNYRNRFAADVYPFNPKVVVLQGSLNDVTGGFSAASMAAEASAVITALNANLTSPTIIFTSQPTSFGVTETTNLSWAQRAAVKAAVLSGGAHYIDLLERPLPIGYTPLTHNLQSSPGVGVSSFTFNGNAPALNGVYEFPDKTRFLVKTVTGTAPNWTVTTEASGLQTSQTSGTLATQVGDCPWTGTGNAGSPAGNGSCDVLVSTDGIHPTQGGHNMIGDMIGEGISDILNVPFTPL
jgi:lysophospholipase L1-like esterase